MADDIAQEIEPTSPPRFQFRLRSLFLLMMITAFSIGAVPVWYHNVIVPADLSSHAKSFMPEDPFNDAVRETEDAKRYTLAFCFIGFVSCCGLWYAFASPANRQSDVWLGMAFAFTFGFVIFPKLWAAPYTIGLFWIVRPAELFFRIDNQFISLAYVFFMAILYSIWPLFLKRYAAAIFLFLYSCVYGVIVLSYANNIIISRLY